MKDTHEFAKWPAWQLTQREMRQVFASAGFWAGFVGVVFLLGISGPFGTDSIVPWPKRFFYWALVAVTTYLMGFLIQRVSFHSLEWAGLKGLPAVVLAGAIAGPFIGGFVFTLNVSVFALHDGSWALFIWIMGITLAVSVVVGVISYMLIPDVEAPIASASEEQGSEGVVMSDEGSGSQEDQGVSNLAIIFDRMEPANQGPILHMINQDHYVEITTIKGQELVLIRLSDAMEAVSGEDGIQIHRSSWVARAGVKALHKDGKRLEVELTDGRRLAVARARMDDVRAWWNKAE